MSPRTGRPKVEKPKNKDVKVRFDEDEHEIILEFCENNDITKTELIRRAVNYYIESKKNK